jgi:hypothetical protein
MEDPAKAINRSRIVTGSQKYRDSRWVIWKGWAVTHNLSLGRVQLQTEGADDFEERRHLWIAVGR